VDVRGFRGLYKAGAAAALGLTMLIGAAAPAHASEVSDHIRAEQWIQSQISKIHKSYRQRSPLLQRAVVLAGRGEDARPGRPTLSILRGSRRTQRILERRTERRLAGLEARRQELEAWLETWAIFTVCPVDAPHYIHNDFGVMVNVDGVEPHVHMGNDIEAPTWTPIRAPFDGYAWGSYSPLGGYQVRVRGPRGYVFNAHLIAYGRLGWVSAGTIIGYVGATGDSTAPHDHFEWHPWNGGAVDPHYLLSLSCD
jgi:murein DD-endopeptidase MepM/ murein hydrolase activator NlpD